MAVDRRSSRLASLGVVAVVLFTALGMRMWFLQVVDAPALEQRSGQQNPNCEVATGARQNF